MQKLNEGWPDPTDWAQRLYEELEKAGEDFAGHEWIVSDDPEVVDGWQAKQIAAANVLAALTKALGELPIFEKSLGYAVLHNVTGAMRDVVLGGAPRIFEAAIPGRRGSDGLQRNYVKFHVVWAFRMLVEDYSYAPSKARKTVTDIFAKAGARGRKGGRLSESTVQGWCDRLTKFATHYEDLRSHEEVEKNLTDFRALSTWPVPEEDALSMIDKVASDPLLTQKYD